MCRHGGATGVSWTTRDRGLGGGSAAAVPASRLLSVVAMKKVTFKKLVVSAETIRTLGAAQLAVAAGGLKGPPVNTTHSLITVCTLPPTTIGITTGTVFDTGVSG